MMIDRTTKLISVSLATMFFSFQSSSAQVTVIRGRDITPAEASPVGTSGKIYKLSVTPAKEASPPLKYRFTVEPHKTIPGNSATHYLRSQGERSLEGPLKYVREQVDEDALSWINSETRTKDIPVDKLRKAAAAFDSYVTNHIARATICRETDWGIEFEDLKGIEAIKLLLPSVQATRSMARVMMLQHRLAIIEGRFDDAVDRLRMTYQLGQNVSKMGILVSSLVGASEVSIANDAALQFVSSNDSPNLYWALAELRTPIIDLRDPMRVEVSMPLRLFPELIDIEQAEYGDEGFKKLFEKYIADFSDMQKIVGGNFDAAPTPTSPALSFAAAMSGYSNAKKRMLKRGYDAGKVDSMSVSQLLLIDAAQDIKYFSQLQERAMYLPYSDSLAIAESTEERLRKQSFTRFGALIFNAISPAVLQVRQTAVRVQAEVNLLMAIESLRNQAAIDGKFPDALNELALPVRNNPFTDRPFNYSVESGNAILTYDLGGGRIHRYEISIAK